jgi:branched-chain amino acid transport system ATP-binding protein
MAEALVVTNLSKRFGGLRAVQDLSFSVREGETVALIGPNGAGKTTSFHLIAGYHRADAGSVTAFGRELVGLRPHQICAHGLARTFQVARPFGTMTVEANVMTGAFLRARRSSSSGSAPRPAARRATSPRSISGGSKWRARWRRSRGSCCSTR